MLIRFILTAAGIIIIFRLFNRFGRHLPLSAKSRYHISYILPLVEFIIWCSIFWWIMKWLFISQHIDILIVTGIILLFFAVMVFYLLYDFVFGLYLKIQQSIFLGDYIVYDDFEGSIVRTGLFSLDIQNKHNEIKTIPYRKIKSSITTTRSENPSLNKHILVFQLPASDHINQQIDKLLKQIMHSPWHAASAPPSVENRSQQNGTINVEIIVFVISQSHAEKIREMVLKEIKKNRIN